MFDNSIRLLLILPVVVAIAFILSLLIGKDDFIEEHDVK
ncbi:unnamed protein product [Schistosoma curassoni]|uniref:Dolichol-phosphate mannosyltransferase subunit 3 n=1 Tax=Schistosoma curassoni TaxID=6186 RepID=A0A183JTB5_9TREM|nr:unnamed protein product [Schistosoma curassoni]